MQTAIQQLVWAHAHAPEGARAVAMRFVVANCRAIQVDAASRRARLFGLRVFLLTVCSSSCCCVVALPVHVGVACAAFG